MSVSVITAALSIIAVAGVYGETRSLPFAAATALGGYKLFHIVRKHEKANDDEMFNACVINPSPTVFAGSTSAASTATFTSIEVQNNIQNIPPSIDPIVNVFVEAPAGVKDSFTTAPDPVVHAPTTTIATTIAPMGVSVHRVAQESIAKNRGKAENDSLSIIKRYAAMRQNLLVLSVGGGGKGILLSNLFRFRAESDPDFFAYWIDPKGESTESGYFDHTSIASHRFDGMKCNKDELSSHIQAAMETYSSIRSDMPPRTPNWLCFDEWTLINHRLKTTNTLSEVHDYVASAVSLSDGQNSHLLLVGQSPKLSDIMADGGGLLANFSSIVLFKREDRSFKMFEKCQQCGTIPKSIGIEKLYAACDQSPVNRAIYIDGQLLPMPRLANYSSYDRDTGKNLNSDSPAGSTKLNPMQIPDCKVAKVMQAIDACTTPSEMASFFDLDNSGQPKSIAALALWKLVKDEGVERAIEVMLPSEESYGEE